MKKIVLLFTALFAVMAANAWTVKFTNPDGWEQVAVWAWDGGTNFTGGKWPGKLMTKGADNIWTYTGEGSPTKIIFNNNDNGQQTGDLDFVDGATYNKQGPVGATYTEGNLYFEIVAPYTTSCYLYTWEPGIAGTWPGTKLEKATLGDGKEYWKFTCYDVTQFNNKTIGGVQLNTGDNSNEKALNNLLVKDGDIINISSGVVGNELTGTYPEGSDPGNPGSDYDSWWVNVFGKWNDNNTYEGGVQPKNGIVTMTGLEIGNVPFGIKTYDDADVYWTYSSPITPGTPVTLTNAGKDFVCAMTVAGATAGSTYNLEFNVETKQLTLTAAGDVPVVYPETMYVIGTVDGNVWDPSKGVAMTKTADGVFTAKFVLATDNDETPGFSFTSQLGSDSNDWDGISAYRYGTGGYGDDTVISAGGSYPCSQNSNPGSYQMSGNNTISVVVDLTQSKMTVSTATGVESVMVDANAPVEYFNLQGVRVANPKNGVFIRVQNGKATKVVK